MTETSPSINFPDPVEVAQTVTKIAAQSQRLVTEFLQRQAADGSLGTSDISSISNTFVELTTKMMTDPTPLINAQVGFWNDYMSLWQSSVNSMLGNEEQNEPVKGDRRFRSEDWQQNLLFDFIKQAYLLSARWALSTVHGIKGLDSQEGQKVDFYTRQFVDALSPTNFAMTNPEVLRATVESGGQNLLNGLSNLLDDLERGKGKLSISMTDTSAFELGKNVATTPGKVVFENEMIQLVQYDPTTKEVYKRPLLVMPPWINKFYILDLQAKNSFIKWATDQGHSVFVISWANPDSSMAEKGFEDYMIEGPLAALDAITEATGEKEINAIGYCIGGTLLNATLAYMATKRDNRIKSATNFTTMLDFSDPGELGIFTDEEQISALEEKMAVNGYLEGSDMAMTFNMLRSNDLIWSFFINNYLLGNDPLPFDLLYWNSDSTRMPAKMHSFYLRKMYLENKLCEPGGISLAGKPIDLTKIKTPAYFISTIEDHIAPWKSTYAGALLPKGSVRFVLGGSGHIAGIVNPPEKNKYGYWTNEKLVQSPDEWLENAKQHEGSWWNDWNTWITSHNADKVPARVPGDGKLKVIEDAPGSYVKVRLVA